MQKKFKQKTQNCLQKGIAAFIVTIFLMGTVGTGSALASSEFGDLLNDFATYRFNESAAQPLTRFGGVDRYETAVKISQAGWEDNSTDYAILSAGMDGNLVDALTAAPLAHLKDAPILLTEGDRLNNYTELDLKRLGVKAVYLTSGPGVIREGVIAELHEIGIETINLGGADRFETAINIAKELGSFDQVIISTAWSNADALSVAAIAASNQIPILLSDPSKLPDKVAQYLAGFTANIQKSYVLGGEGVLSKTVEQALPNPERVGGADRYETNTKILDAFKSRIRTKKIFVASGNDKNLVDALAGSSLAALTASPMILVDNQNLPLSTEEYVRKNIFPLTSEDLIVLGGETIIPLYVLESMKSVVNLNSDGATNGGPGILNPVVYPNNIVVTGQNMTIVNTTTHYNMYVEGNNTTLKNVVVEGALILNPGVNGKVNLDGVKAGNILVISGAQDGIVLKDSTADSMMVMGNQPVGVVATGSTKVTRTMGTTTVILDTQGGSFGDVYVVKLDPSFKTEVSLKGKFEKPIFALDGTVKNLSSELPVLIVASPENGQKVVIEGNYNVVQILTPSDVDIAAGAIIDNLIANSQAVINIDATAVVKNRTNML